MKTIRLLSIGNSFSNDATDFLPAIAESSQTLRIQRARASLGGCSLEKHWNLVGVCDIDVNFKPYGPHKGDMISLGESHTLKELLTLKEWDVVTLQQVSHKSWRPETYEPYFGNLHGLVRELSPTAEIKVHQTWAYREDSSFFIANGLTQQSMYEKLAAAYSQIAESYGCELLPSGAAIQNARDAAGAFEYPDPDYCYHAPIFPELPSQAKSFNVGWHWQKITEDGRPTLGHDTIHLNARGRYLAAATWFETLGGGDVRETTFRPEDIEEEDWRFLQTVAHETVDG